MLFTYDVSVFISDLHHKKLVLGPPVCDMMGTRRVKKAVVCMTEVITPSSPPYDEGL